MHGKEAKKAATNKPAAEEIVYQGQTIKISSTEHHELMRQAIKAKLEQNLNVLTKLLETGNIRITHFVTKKDGTLEPDSQSIPREIFAQMLMELRTEFRNRVK